MKHAAALTLCLLVSSAHAQPVYRCGNAYSQTPCPQGKLVEATDPRSAAQRAEAIRVAAEDRRLAADMKRERLAAQAAAQKPAAAASLSATPLPLARPAPAAERQASRAKRAAVRPSASTPFTAADTAGTAGTAGKKQRGRSKP